MCCLSPELGLAAFTCGGRALRSVSLHPSLGQLAEPREPPQRRPARSQRQHGLEAPEGPGLRSRAAGRAASAVGTGAGHSPLKTPGHGQGSGLPPPPLRGYRHTQGLRKCLRLKVAGLSTPGPAMLCPARTPTGPPGLSTAHPRCPPSVCGFQHVPADALQAGDRAAPTGGEEAWVLSAPSRTA